MTTSWLSLTVTAILLALLQLAASWPWRLGASLSFRRRFFSLTNLLREAGLAILLGGLFGFWLYANSDPRTLARAGRFYMSLLHLQLGADALVFILAALLRWWPKGGAVCLAAFLEGLREPKFWFLFVIAALLMGVSPFIPYFTFGEDLKMMKEICYAFAMFAPTIYGVLTGAMSVSEEIEGRTAVTLLSKPISRRQFLLGKFYGITLTCVVMTMLLGWILVWLILYKPILDGPRAQEGPPPQDPVWAEQTARAWLGNTGQAEIVRGAFLWTHDAAVAVPGLVTGFCQVMIMTACAVSLATRLPMVVNLVVCLVLYFLGHLTAIITEVTRGLKLVHFMAQLFHTLLPGLDHFDVGPALIRDAPLPTVEYGIYTGYVVMYGILYTAIALLVGLILFEDRDLA